MSPGKKSEMLQRRRDVYNKNKKRKQDGDIDGEPATPAERGKENAPITPVSVGREILLTAGQDKHRALFDISSYIYGIWINYV